MLVYLKMPTITFAYKDLCNLVGKKISIEEIAKLLESGKGELDGYDEETDEISVSFGDTNLPYLWSVEGVARLIKGLTGVQKGIPKLEIKKAELALKQQELVLEREQERAVKIGN